MSYTHFTLTERYSLQQLLNEGKSFREIARILGRSPSTISREVKRNWSKKKNRYNPWRATTLYIIRRKKCVRQSVIQPNTKLYRFIVRKATKRAFELLEIDIPVLTMTLDNGSEFADFKGIEEDLNTTIYFADPHSPWQRGSNENMNDIIRFFFPKGTDFSLVSEDQLMEVVNLINSRPRKCLDYLSPFEIFSKKCCT